MRDESFGHWLSGFTDGEGSFVLTIQRQYGREHPRAIFQIIVRTDDTPILERIKAYFGCGSIYQHKRKGKSRKIPFWFTAHYMVYKPEELFEIIIPHFEQFPLRAKKAKDFGIWKQAVVLTNAVKARRQRGGVGQGPFMKWQPRERKVFARLLAKLQSSRALSHKPVKNGRLRGEPR